MSIGAYLSHPNLIPQQLQGENNHRLIIAAISGDDSQCRPVGRIMGLFSVETGVVAMAGSGRSVGFGRGMGARLYSVGVNRWGCGKELVRSLNI